MKSIIEAVASALNLSLPTGERGLKSNESNIVVKFVQSLPTGERGLKSVQSAQSNSLPPSLPTGERGLKFMLCLHYVYIFCVAPYWGAWIEINLDSGKKSCWWVAPYWGAWIEITEATVVYPENVESLPTGERGLKLSALMPLII